jgi:hypothetical protein
MVSGPLDEPMDLTLACLGTTYRLMPHSALGMLWLQTHFEDEHWELLSFGGIQLEADCADELCSDATEAGVAISRLAAAAPAAPSQTTPHQA